MQIYSTANHLRNNVNTPTASKTKQNAENKNVAFKGNEGNDSFKSIYEPRKNSPVIFVHGLGTNALSLKNYYEAAQNAGYTINTENYDNIAQTGAIAESAKEVSSDTNIARINITKKQLDKIIPAMKDDTVLEKYFKLDPALSDKNKKTLTGLIKDTVASVNKVVNDDDNSEPENNFSSQIKEIETNLKDQIKDTDLIKGEKGSKTHDLLCSKVAGDIIETVSPKATMIAHSMGAFVTNTVALNPETYDAGHGLGSILTLSGALNGKKMSATESLVARKYDYDEYNKGQQPLTREEELNAAKIVSRRLEASLRKGNAALVDAHSGSDFFKKNIKGKQVPEGVSLVSAWDKKDRIVEPNDSKIILTDENTNYHHVEVDIPLNLEKDTHGLTPNAAIHLKIAARPDVVAGKFKENMINDPLFATRVLDARNNEGLRYIGLGILKNEEKKNPGFLEEKGLIFKLKEVAEEQLPFTDSPSYTAKEILSNLNKN
ncbi:MAG TPA: hypothetical protein P5556_04795 [Candidatus Gastranaerophilales bacterium]|nr:hypothetical protein [Candidatus Gastranaerophilales bacterium]